MIRILLACAALVMSSAACAPVGQREVEIVLRHSHFEPAALTVPAGVPITFVLKNVDPIDHEWMIGDARFHERHRTGTETLHDGRPNEMTVPAQSERRTTLTFAVPATLTFICHLPGHERYGMVGSLTSR
ncbi:MAG TPA: cupredoxin domain-containing protein [Candidatus Limnocylindria bacterium]